MLVATPPQTKCAHCDTVAAEAVCHVCKTERPDLTALKKISRKAFGVEPNKEAA